MKKTPLKKVGKRGRQWILARAKLKKEYERRGITKCEIHLPGCWGDNGLGFAHRHKRAWYYSRPGLIGQFNQTLLACNSCHDKIEHDKQATEAIFKIRR